MKYILIVAGSRIELNAFLEANPWINREAVISVREADDLRTRGGLVLALPGWEHSPSIRRPRELLEAITRQGMQLVVLEQAAYQIRPIETVFGSMHQHTVQRFEGELP